MLETGKAKLNSFKNIKWKLAAAEKLPFKNDSFDFYTIGYGIRNVTNINLCLKTNWISSQGKFIRELESKISKYHKAKFCVVTSSCTSSLHLALLSCDIKKNDEVICPDLSFIAPANMILLTKAKLVLVDIDPITLNIDTNKIEKFITKKTKAIIFVNQFGQPANINELIKISRKYT